MDTERVFVIAGEASGDLHASGLVRALSRRRPQLEFSGIGGPRLQDAGMSLLHHSDQLAFMGFAEVLLHLPYLFRVMGDVRHYLATYRPRLVILVDYPAFNLRVARTARALGCKVLYYIPPQVWAWHEERVVSLAELTDAIACVLPFEEEFFAAKGQQYGVKLNARYVGHPLVDTAAARTDAGGLCSELLLPDGVTLLALMPGSRRQEVARLLPVMAEAVHLLRSRRPELVPLLCAAPGVGDKTYERLLGGTGLKLAGPLPPANSYEPSAGIHLVRGRTYDVLAAARSALVASGTATLEAGLLDTPMVIAYRMNPISWRIGRARVKVPHVGLVNLLAGERLVPELLQGNVSGGTLAEHLTPLLDDGPQRRRVLEGFQRVRQRLGAGGAAERAADMAEELLEARHPEGRTA